MIKGRKLISACLSSLVFMLCENAYSLGLGEMRLHSHLNEPLLAEISLEDTNGVALNEIITKIGDPNEFAQIGVEAPDWLSEIEIELKSQDAKDPYILLKTSDPIKDPFTYIVISLTWPQGKLVREYTVLLDPPKFAFPQTRNLKLTTPQESLNRSRRSAPSTSVQKITLGKAYGPVYQETLWSIAKKLVASTSFSVHQGVMAIADKNPDAFMGGNIDQIKKGTVLKLPSLDELSQYSHQQAQHFVQTRGEDRGEVPVSAPTQRASNEALVTLPTGVESVEKPLKLVAPLSQEQFVEAKQLTPPQEVTSPQAPMTQRITLIEEAIDTLKRSNETISEKNQNLLQENELLASQLAKKDEEINRLKEAVQKVPKEVLPAPQSTLLAPQNVLPAPQSALSEPINPPVNVSDHGSELSGNHFFFIFFMLLISGSMFAWIWFSRERLQLFLASLSGGFKPDEDRGLSFSTKEEIPFDLEKAIAAVATQEKKFLQPRQPKEKPLDSTKSLHSGLEDAELYIAYERYADAEKLLKELLTQYPQNAEIFLKLLEICILTEKYDAFKHWHEQIPLEIEQTSPQIWAKINLLVEKVKNEKIGELKPVSQPSKLMIEKPLVKQEESLKNSPLPFPDQLSTPPIKPHPEEKHDPQAYLSLAQAFIQIGDKEAAREQLVKALAHGDDEQKKQAQMMIDELGRLD